MSAFDVDCLFCKIIKGEIPSNKVYEDDAILAFHDIAPQAPVHVVCIPKQHVAGLNDLALERDSAWIGKLMTRAPRIAAELGVAESGYRIVINSGRNGGQSVFHLHIHILGGRALSWPPG